MALDLIARLKLDDQMSSPLSRVSSHMNRMESSTRKASDGVKNFNASVGGIATAIGLTAAVAGGFGMIRSSIGSAFDRIDTMEQFSKVMGVMLGDVDKANAALEQTREIVTGTAFGLDVAASAVQGFVTSGMKVEDATRVMGSFTDAVAFYTKGTNAELDSVTDALTKMSTKGTVSLEQLNRMLDMGIPAIDIYAEAMNMSTEEVTKAISKGSIEAGHFMDVMDEAFANGTEKFPAIAGAAKDAGASWAGSFDNMRAAVTRGVISIIDNIDELLKDNGIPDMRKMISNFGSSFEKALNKVGNAVRKVSGPLGKLIKALKPYAPMFEKMAKAIGIAVAAVGGIYLMTTAFTILGGALAILTSPLGLVFLAIAALAFGFQLAYEKSETFRNAIDLTVGAVQGFMSAMNGEYKNAHDIMEKAGLTPEAASRVMQAAGMVSDGVQKVKDVFAGLNELTPVSLMEKLGVSEETITSIMGLADSVRNTIDSIKETFSGLSEGISPGIEDIVGKLVGFRDAASDVFNSLMDVAKPILDALSTAFGILAEAASMVFNSVLLPAIDLAVWAFKTLWKVVGPILELLGAAIELAFTVLKVMWDTILAPYVNYLTGVFARAVEKTTGGIDAVGDAFDIVGGIISGAARLVKDFARALKNVKIPEWVSTVGGKLAHAAGAANRFMGIGGNEPVTSRYHGIDRVARNGTLARLHTGERVLTKQEADTMDARYSYDELMGASNTYNTYNNVSNTQASAKASKGDVHLTVNYQGGGSMDEAEMSRFGTYLVNRVFAAAEGGAQ